MSRKRDRAGRTAVSKAVAGSAPPKPAPPVVQFQEIKSAAPHAAAGAAEPGASMVVPSTGASVRVVPPPPPDPEDAGAAAGVPIKKRGGQFSARLVVVRNKYHPTDPERQIITPMIPPDAYRERMKPGDEITNGNKPGQPVGQEIAFDSEEERDEALAAHGWRRHDPLRKNDLDSSKPPAF